MVGTVVEKFVVARIIEYTVRSTVWRQRKILEGHVSSMASVENSWELLAWPKSMFEDLAKDLWGIVEIPRTSFTRAEQIRKDVNFLAKIGTGDG